MAASRSGFALDLIQTVAIVATLIYVAIEINQNTRAIRSASYADFMSSAQAVNEIAITNADITPEVWEHDWDKLDARLHSRINAQLVAMLNIYEATYLFYINGAVDQPYFEGRMRALAVNLETPLTRDWWDNGVIQRYADPRFVSYVNNELLGQD